MNIRDWLNVALFSLLLTGCSTPSASPANLTPTVSVPVALSNVKDERGQFRNLFCQLIHRDGIKSNEDCTDWLRRLKGEDNSGPDEGNTEYPLQKTPLLIIPGIFGECVQDQVTVLGDAISHLTRLGYQSTTVAVKGRASDIVNARIIRDTIISAARTNPKKRFLVIAYSKGVSDFLTALTLYPEIQPHISAVISLAGAVNGTPLADQISRPYTKILSRLPDEHCPVTDHNEITSLTRNIRLSWLASHPLPVNIPYYSIVALPELQSVSAILLPFYLQLAASDPNNDSQVIHYDAIIPGSTLLGYANADHWAIALPFEFQQPALAATLVNRNHFPRVQLLEAAVRIAENPAHAVIKSKPLTGSQKILR